jgi:hypothetical protein
VVLPLDDVLHVGLHLLQRGGCLPDPVLQARQLGDPTGDEVLQQPLAEKVNRRNQV